MRSAAFRTRADRSLRPSTQRRGRRVPYRFFENLYVAARPRKRACSGRRASSRRPGTERRHALRRPSSAPPERTSPSGALHRRARPEAARSHRRLRGGGVRVGNEKRRARELPGQFVDARKIGRTQPATSPGPLAVRRASLRIARDEIRAMTSVVLLRPDAAPNDLAAALEHDVRSGNSSSRYCGS